MSLKKVQIPQFEIHATSVYVESESAPDQNRYFFAYKIAIKNKGNQVSQLMSRHWIITDSHGQVEEVRGAGVIGLQPKINPGQNFEYESVCPLSTPSGSMKGFYQMLSSEGESFDIEIPEFYLIAPTALH